MASIAIALGRQMPDYLGAVLESKVPWSVPWESAWSIRGR
jgi:hypothetical protein